MIPGNSETEIQQQRKLNELNLLSCAINPVDLKLMEKVGQGKPNIL